VYDLPLGWMHCTILAPELSETCNVLPEPIISCHRQLLLASQERSQSQAPDVCLHNGATMSRASVKFAYLLRVLPHACIRFERTLAGVSVSVSSP